MADCRHFDKLKNHHISTTV